VGNPEKLPSPEQLKGKIILSARVDRELSEESDEGTKEHPIGEVWYLSKEEDEKEEDKSKRGWKKRDVILRGDALSFHAQTSAILTKMTRKPFFVGAMSRTPLRPSSMRFLRRRPRGGLSLCIATQTTQTSRWWCAKEQPTQKSCFYSIYLFNSTNRGK